VRAESGAEIGRLMIWNQLQNNPAKRSHAVTRGLSDTKPKSPAIRFGFQAVTRGQERGRRLRAKRKFVSRGALDAPPQGERHRSRRVVDRVGRASSLLMHVVGTPCRSKEDLQVPNRAGFLGAPLAPPGCGMKPKTPPSTTKEKHEAPADAEHAPRSDSTTCAHWPGSSTKSAMIPRTIVIRE
jgi:hypothetical protein